jgi:hypothetical protein
MPAELQGTSHMARRLQASGIEHRDRRNAMPYCPRCRNEYVAEMTHCDDCDVELVPALPEAGPPPDFHWVELCTALSEPEGEMLRELLEARGIPVMVKNVVFASGFGRQGTLILVPARHRQDALAVSAQVGAE